MDNAIAHYRRLRGLSQAQLALKSGVSIKGLQKLERGERTLMKAQLGTVLQLAQALGITVEELASSAQE